MLSSAIRHGLGDQPGYEGKVLQEIQLSTLGDQYQAVFVFTSPRQNKRKDFVYRLPKINQDLLSCYIYLGAVVERASLERMGANTFFIFYFEDGRSARFTT